MNRILNKVSTEPKYNKPLEYSTVTTNAEDFCTTCVRQKNDIYQRLSESADSNYKPLKGIEIVDIFKIMEDCERCYTSETLDVFIEQIVSYLSKQKNPTVIKGAFGTVAYELEHKPSFSAYLVYEFLKQYIKIDKKIHADFYTKTETGIGDLIEYTDHYAQIAFKYRTFKLSKLVKKAYRYRGIIKSRLKVISETK